jgi:hypothetical protein
MNTQLSSFFPRTLSLPRVGLLAAATATTLFVSACSGGSSDASDPAAVANAAHRGNRGARAANAASSASASTPASNTTTVPGAVSSASTQPSGSIFYGMNGHNNHGGAYFISSISLQLQQLQDLGVKVYRNEVYDSPSATKLAGIADTMAAGGVTVYPVMLVGIDYNSETDAYNDGFALGVATAKARKWPWYEVSNELDNLTLTGTNVDGVYPTDFDNAKFMKARGVIRGMIAGVKSVDSNAKIVIGGLGWLHYAFDQMLANGTQPDGTSGHPVVTWDITAWHWYSELGDITHACGVSGCYNVLATLQKLGKPIWINEFGVNPGYGTQEQSAQYLVGNKMMQQFVSLAPQYDIESIQMYELYDDPAGGEGPFGLLLNDGKTIKQQYYAFKSFVAANPR